MDKSIYEFFGRLEKDEIELRGKANKTPKSKANQEIEANRPTNENECRFKHPQGGKFLSEYDMAEAKRLESIINSQVKRGERDKKHTMHHRCGCGADGCIFIS